MRHSSPSPWWAVPGRALRVLLARIGAWLSPDFRLLNKLLVVTVVLLGALLVHVPPISLGTSGSELPPTQPTEPPTVVATPDTSTPSIVTPHHWEVESLPGSVVLGGGSFIEPMGQEFVRLAGGPSARLVIVPTAYGGTEEEGIESFIKEWGGRHPASVQVLHTHDRAVANDPNFVAPLRTATGVWFTGGKQYRLLDTYEGTLFHQELREVLQRGGAVGGNCAGAMALGELTIDRGKEPVVLRPGLGIIPKLIVDSHWLERNRIERLRGVIEEHPDHFGLGIDRQTAIVIERGQLRFVGNSYAATVVPVPAPQDVRIDVWEAGDVVDLGSLFNGQDR